MKNEEIQGCLRAVFLDLYIVLYIDVFPNNEATYISTKATNKFEEENNKKSR